METAAIVLGCGGQAVAWWLVASGVNVWRIVPPVFAACGLLGLVVGEPLFVRNPALGDGATGAAAALAIGMGAGVALYAGTLAFTTVAASWERFRRHTGTSYRRARSVALPMALGLTAVAVVGEELFWRGLVQTELSAALGSAIGAAAATAVLYVASNATSRSLPIVIAAIVGGALWAWLALATGSILAPLLSHLAWTWLMLALPPRAGREMMSP
jgi:hypothetical protein